MQDSNPLAIRSEDTCDAFSPGVEALGNSGLALVPGKVNNQIVKFFFIIHRLVN
jgi:hypothetical protein